MEKNYNVNSTVKRKQSVNKDLYSRLSMFTQIEDDKGSHMSNPFRKQSLLAISNLEIIVLMSSVRFYSLEMHQ